MYYSCITELSKQKVKLELLREMVKPIFAVWFLLNDAEDLPRKFQNSLLLIPIF